MNVKLYIVIGLLIAAVGVSLLVQKKHVDSPPSVSSDGLVVSKNTLTDATQKNSDNASDLKSVETSKINDTGNKQNQDVKPEPAKSGSGTILPNQTQGDSVPVEPGTPSESNQDTIAITINWEKLTAEEVQSLIRIYGSVRPGDYWYDQMTGLYGVMGSGPLGIIATGYNFGPMPKNASNGNTGVIINGREITYAEVALLSRYVGQVIPGSYWLDSGGNYGFAGSNVTLGNLYASAGGGASAGGDNFWSGSYSAGNYNSDNTQGYVSVPGIGPVGYGM